MATKTSTPAPTFCCEYAKECHYGWGIAASPSHHCDNRQG